MGEEKSQPGDASKEVERIIQTARMMGVEVDEKAYRELLLGEG